jgi:hypothetical protein
MIVFKLVLSENYYLNELNNEWSKLVGDNTNKEYVLDERVSFGNI